MGWFLLLLLARGHDTIRRKSRGRSRPCESLWAQPLSTGVRVWSGRCLCMCRVGKGKLPSRSMTSIRRE